MTNMVCSFSSRTPTLIHSLPGVLLHCASRIEQRIQNESSESDSSASDIEYPLTPPPSDCADSRPLSPAPNLSHVITIEIPRNISNKLSVRKRRSHNCEGSAAKPLTLCIISRNSAKPAIAAAARTFLQAEKQRTTEPQSRAPPEITEDMLSMSLECKNVLSSPDFMIVYPINPCDGNLPVELHGFPPWHIRLTEIHYRRSRERPRKINSFVLDEIAFREALDEYETAEFRFGK
ncbi:hypothetical protein AX15_001835 [Amanita polypyramis BW_CC]|nr:hypothetical protein AX15_001835 [Amanita polypyramis BW_CC]